MPDARLDRPARDARPSEPDPGGGWASRVRIDGYACHLAHPLAPDDLRRLVASLAGRRRWGPDPQNGHALAGRSAIRRHELPGIGTVVIKEYRRGGLLRFMRRRHYIRIGPTRPEREFRNLRTARDAGLNVPEPVLSVSRGKLFYRGWLVTRFIAGRSLVDVVSSRTDGIPDLLDDLTRQVGLLIERRLAHVDLHPGNVLVDAAGRLHLLDFDRVFAFDEPADELRRRYEVRWRRAVEKHGLPAILIDRFSEGLARLSLPAA